MPAPDRSHALDHIVVVLFENRSLDNVLGHLYGPADGKSFDGVIGKGLSNPIPSWAEHGADRKVVHGKVSMAKLYASEMAGRVSDRAVQALGGRGYMVESAAARFYRELRVDRIWEGTSEIQRSIISRGIFRRGAAPYLGWE